MRHKNGKRATSVLLASGTRSLGFAGRLGVGALVLLAAASARMASAQVSFTLTSYYGTVAAGGETFFYGTITNNGSTQVYLNELDIVQNAGTTPSSGVFSSDDSPFFNNAPATLAANGGTFTGQLFGIKATNALTVTSQYNGSVSLYGGSTDSSNTLLSGPLAFMVVDVDATPEPATAPLILLGLTTMGGIVYRRTRTRRTL